MFGLQLETWKLIKIGAAFSVVELVWKPIQYYIHERVWYKWIKYGISKKD
jgi:uncharacterized membrane protein